MCPSKIEFQDSFAKLVKKYPWYCSVIFCDLFCIVAVLYLLKSDLLVTKNKLFNLFATNATFVSMF